MKKITAFCIVLSILLCIACEGLFERIITVDTPSLPMDDGDSIIHNIVVVRVNAADRSFIMGSPASEAGRYFDETQREVTLTKNFWISKFPITNRQFGRRSVAYDRLDHPVTDVSWYEARDFAERVGGRLPTEAEWEFTARGGEAGVLNGHIYSGSDDPDAVGWYEENSGGRVHIVYDVIDSAKNKRPNELGIYGMSGNVFEWVQDWYSYYDDTPVIDPTGPEEGIGRVHRGGAWNRPARDLRVADRAYSAPEYKSGYIGFRVLFEIEDEVNEDDDNEDDENEDDVIEEEENEEDDNEEDVIEE